MEGFSTIRRHTLQINEEAHIAAEKEEEEKKKPDEDEMFESLIQRLNEQKREHNKKNGSVS